MKYNKFKPKKYGKTTQETEKSHTNNQKKKKKKIKGQIFELILVISFTLYAKRRKIKSYIFQR